MRESIFLSRSICEGSTTKYGLPDYKPPILNNVHFWLGYREGHNNKNRIADTYNIILLLQKFTYYFGCKAEHLAVVLPSLAKKIKKN